MGILGIISKLRRVEEVMDELAPKVSLDTFMESISDTIDDLINQEKENGLLFLGGKSHFYLSEDSDKVEMKVELFFKSRGEFVKKETKGCYPISMLNQSARENLVEILQTEGEYVVEVEEP